MPVATGTMQVTSWDEEPLAEVEADEMKLTKASGAQEFGGSIEGAGFVTWLMAYAPTGSARFVGLNRISGVLAGRRGSFVVESSGDHDGKQSTGTWAVVPGSGTGDLATITGTGEFEAPGGPAVTYRLEYDLS